MGWMDRRMDKQTDRHSEANSRIFCNFSVHVCQKQMCELHNSRIDVTKYGINLKIKNTTYTVQKTQENMTKG